MSAAATWGRIHPDDVSWDPPAAASGAVRLRTLSRAPGPSIVELDLAAGAVLPPYRPSGNALWLISRGTLVSRSAGTLDDQDVCVLRGGAAEPGGTAGPAGLRAMLLSLERDPLRIEWLAAALHEPAPRRASLRDTPFLDFPDEHGRETQPVQLLFTDGPYVLRTRFRPTFTAGEHWHEHDTVYFVRDGGMQFGPQEPWYGAGDIRWVRGGHAYGPEQPGPQGVDFVLVSLGGPVTLNWADLVPAPRGRLAAR